MNLLASLRYLAALDDHKHFGRAAEACHITQPALSNALRALETEFGAVIVKRGRNFEGFTEEGSRVLASARRMLQEREALQQDLNSSAGNPCGSLKLGAVPTAMPIATRFAARLQAQHPGIAPVVIAMSSDDMEIGLESLSLDMGLGYTERLRSNAPRLDQIAQYTEHYFFVQRAARPGKALQTGAPIGWAQAARQPLCLLTREMHNRSIVEKAISEAGAVCKPVMETNSVLSLAISVADGQVCTVMPGALVGVLLGYRELEALPLIAPEVRTAIGMMVKKGARPSRTLEAALAMARDADWLRHAAVHSGLLGLTA